MHESEIEGFSLWTCFFFTFDVCCINAAGKDRPEEGHSLLQYQMPMPCGNMCSPNIDKYVSNKELQNTDDFRLCVASFAFCFLRYRKE